MLYAFLFLVYWAANFVWLLLVIGAMMAHFMSPSKHKNNIILVTVAVLSLLFVIWQQGRPLEDDTIMTKCFAMADGC